MKPGKAGSRLVWDMNKKTAFQILLLALLVGGGLYWVAGLFRPEKIQILCDIHPPRVSKKNPRAANPPPAFEVAFGFDQKCTLTDVRVVALEEWATNQLARPLWHLVADSNAVPTRAVVYGQWVRGMRPAVKGKRAEPLQPNVAYRLLIEAGSSTGECDFKLSASPAR